MKSKLNQQDLTFIVHPSSLKWKPAEELNLMPFRPTLVGSV
ncbi:MAG: hypothetical protein ABR568_13275 [Pyrinomonadaceae bacterium]